MIFIISIVFALLAPAGAWGEDLSSSTESDRIQRLEKRLEKLEAERGPGRLTPPNADPSRRFNRGISIPGARAPRATGPSRRFNPAISVSGLLLGTHTNQGNADSDREVKTGMDIQEVEINLSANVDHWLRARLTLAMEETDDIEIEEFITEALIAKNLSLRAGKFFTEFGKHNLLHTHVYPFIDQPLVNEEILGEEGLNEIGMSLDALLPLPFFSSLSLQFLEGDNDLFAGPLNDDFLYLVHSKNLFDLTADLTAELGVSFATGRNGAPLDSDDHTHLAGADLTFKWKPAGRELYRTFIWQSEFMNASGVNEARGVYSLLRYQFARRWWAQGRYGFFTRKGGEDPGDQNRISALLAFVPSEFSTLRLQYNYLDPSQGEVEHQVLLQLNFSMGSHPAHAY